MGSRFSDRTKRYRRRQESSFFTQYIVPLSWLVCTAGVLGFAVVFLEEYAKGNNFPNGKQILMIMACSPLLVGVVRLARGHFSKSIREGYQGGEND